MPNLQEQFIQCHTVSEPCCPSLPHPKLVKGVAAALPHLSHVEGVLVVAKHVIQQHSTILLHTHKVLAS